MTDGQVARRLGCLAVLALCAPAGARRLSAQDDQPSAEEWLLIERPEGEEAPTRYWLPTLLQGVAFRALVDIAKLRWRIERDYQELKQEVGLGYYEGRGGRGLHHHVTLCIAAYGFLISERERIPPSGPVYREIDMAAAHFGRADGPPPQQRVGVQVGDQEAVVEGAGRRPRRKSPVFCRAVRHGVDGIGEGCAAGHEAR